jgi:nitric oxide synthase-interacting protein
MTPQGVLYEKEAILECLLNQKKEYARKLALYEAAAAGEAREADAAVRAAEEARLEQFHRANNGGGGPLPGGGAGGGGGAASGELNAFWVPSKTPHAASHADKPSSDTLCPATGKKLRMKELTPVRFTRVPGDAPEDGGARFMCPTCKEVSSLSGRVICPRGCCTGALLRLAC